MFLDWLVAPRLKRQRDAALALVKARMEALEPGPGRNLWIQYGGKLSPQARAMIRGWIGSAAPDSPLHGANVFISGEDVQAMGYSPKQPPEPAAQQLCAQGSAGNSRE